MGPRGANERTAHGGCCSCCCCLWLWRSIESWHQLPPLQVPLLPLLTARPNTCSRSSLDMLVKPGMSISLSHCNLTRLRGILSLSLSLCNLTRLRGILFSLFCNLTRLRGILFSLSLSLFCNLTRFLASSSLSLSLFATWQACEASSSLSLTKRPAKGV